MFGTKWKGEYVVVHTGLSSGSRKRALKNALKNGYEPHTEGPTNMTFRKRTR